MARRRRGGDKPSGDKTWLVLGIVAAVVAVGWLAFGSTFTRGERVAMQRPTNCGIFTLVEAMA